MWAIFSLTSGRSFVDLTASNHDPMDVDEMDEVEVKKDQSDSMPCPAILASTKKSQVKPSLANCPELGVRGLNKTPEEIHEMPKKFGRRKMKHENGLWKHTKMESGQHLIHSLTGNFESSYSVKHLNFIK